MIKLFKGLEEPKKGRGEKIILLSVEASILPNRDTYFIVVGFPGNPAGKEFACNAGDPYSVPWLGRSWKRDRLPTLVFLGFPHCSDGQESTCNAGDLGSIPGLGRSPGEENSYPLQCCGLENSLDRGAWQATNPCRLHSILIWPFVSKTALTEDCKHLVPQDCFCHCSASVAATKFRKRKFLLYPFSSNLPCMTLILAEYKMGS